MSLTNLPYEKYCSGDYARDNPDWDMADSTWKAGQVYNTIQKNNIQPRSVVEVGCGAGAILAELERNLPDAMFKGYDIAPDAAPFWAQHKSARTSFEIGDFLQINNQHFDLLLLLDVLEHLPEPFSFLVSLRGHADYFVFHIPLDLSSISVLRENPLLHVRNKVGHIHYFTKGLALSLLEECGYSIINWRYTGAAYNAPQRTWKTYLANIPRYLVSKINKDIGVRLLGGETLIVLAKGNGAA